MIPKMTARIQRLQKRAAARQLRGGMHFIYEEEDQMAYARLARAVYGRPDGEPPVLRKAAFLETFAREMPVTIHADEVIVGDQTFSLVHRNPKTRQYLGEIPFPQNKGHIAVDYDRVVRLGVSGLQGEAEALVCEDDRSRRNKEAYLRTLRAFSRFIERHAEEVEEAASRCGCPSRQQELEEVARVCRHLVHGGAETFHQALQMTWFIQIFLHAEGSSAAVSFGRFDQALQPYWERDLREDPAFDGEKALELLAAFFIKTCEGDESQNLTLGGLDAEGRPADNMLTELCLRTMEILDVWQPSLSLRMHPDTPKSVWEAALRLAAGGRGQPSFFNDSVIIQGLEELDIPLPRARDWSVVGCFEAAPDGDCYPLTTLGECSLPQILLDFLKGEEQAPDYPAFEDRLRTYLQREWARKGLPELQKRWNRLRDQFPSPFESLCVTGCIESGRTTQEGGAPFNLAGFNVLGLGTFIDSLYAIKKLVYEAPEMTLNELKGHLASNLEDPVLRSRLRQLPGKFGCDSPETNEMARQWSTFIAGMIIGSRMEEGVRPYPGFYDFLKDVRAEVPATPDGRRDGEILSYGAGPGCLAVDTTPTSVLNSVARVAHPLAVNGNPLIISLCQSDVEGEEGLDRLRHLIEGYFSQGGFHLQFNIVDAKKLREAQQCPEEHGELVVRISGFSARFVTLDKPLQDAIIVRTEHGL